jgi:hypothetical protein
MRELLPKLSPRVWMAVALLALPAGSAGQVVREVVSNRLSIGSDEATLLLEFRDGATFEVAFLDGEILVDGNSIGSYSAGDDIDDAWRDLLGDVTSLHDGDLARALRDWDPPESLSGDAAEIAERLDDVLEKATVPVSQAEDRAFSVALEDGDLQVSIDASELLKSLLRTQLIPALSEALEDVEVEGITFYIDEDVEIDSEVSGSILVVDGDLILSNEVHGDVVVVRGSLTLDPGAQVIGDVKLLRSRLYREGGEILGDVTELDDESLRSRIRDELRSEVRNEIRHTGRNNDEGVFAPFASVTRGISSLFEDLITFIVLSVLGLGVVFLAKDNLEVVADTARRSPGRAGMVGLAGAFLVLPVWVLGSVALAISIVGIIALPFWVVLFPLAVVLAIGLGYFGVARNIGEWLAAQRLNGLDWLRSSNAAYAVIAGIGTLVAFPVAAHVVGIVPGFGFFSGLFTTLGSIAVFAVLCIGFGAVLLTRGGRQSEFYDVEDSFGDTDWSAAAQPAPGTVDDAVIDDDDDESVDDGGSVDDA